MRNSLGAILLTIVVSGCASLSPEGSMVRLASQVGSDCEFVGSVSGSVWINNGDNHLKNEAAKMGGNWVVVTGYRYEGLATGNKPSPGEVYSCPESRGSAKRVDKAITVDLNQTSRDVSAQKAEGGTLQKMEMLKTMYDQGLINKSEYDQKRKQLLDQMN